MSVYTPYAEHLSQKQLGAIRVLREVFERKLSDGRMKGIGIHRKPHLDELAGIAVLRDWAKERYGVASLPLVILDDNSGDDTDWWLEVNDILPIGIRGGPLDDHAEAYRNITVKGEPLRFSCFDLVLIMLGMEDHAELRKIRHYIHHNDCYGVYHGSFDLANNVKVLHAKDGGNTEEVYEIFKTIFDGHLRQGREENAAEIEFRTKAIVERFICSLRPGKNGANVPVFGTLASIVSDIDNLPPVGYRLGHSVIIVARSGLDEKGFLYIGAAVKCDITLERVIALLRAFELRLNGVSFWDIEGRGDRTTRYAKLYERLSQPGTDASVPAIYYQVEHKRIFNGNDGHPSVERIATPLHEVVKLTHIGVQPYASEEWTRVWRKFLTSIDEEVSIVRRTTPVTAFPRTERPARVEELETSNITT